MRITLNLSIFFHDHRSLAKIFVNKNMQYIKDVENHISNIFGIKNFYLKCENQYLPPSEDVSVLNEDDFVWVVPYDEIPTFAPVVQEEINNQHENGEMLEDLKVHKKKKEKLDETLELEEVSAIYKAKKNKKKHHDKEKQKDKKQRHDVEEKQKDKKKRHDVEEKQKNKKKRLDVEEKESSFNETPLNIQVKDKSTPNNLEKPNQKMNSPACTKESSSEDSSNEDLKTDEQGLRSTSVKKLVNTFENKLFSPSFQEPNCIINNSNEKRINIVKTIIVSNGKNTCENVESPVAQKDGFSEDPAMEVNDTSIKDDTSVEGSVRQVRKRKRVRKHPGKRVRIDRKRMLKKMNKSFPEALNEVPGATFSISFKPLPEKAPLHLRFDETDAKSNEVIEKVEEKNDTKNTSIELTEKNEIEATEKNETEGKNDKEDTITRLNDDIITKFDFVTDDEKFVNCMLKHPITANIEPRKEDIIAFKILRISESYTPEVSSCIVGKVLNYEKSSKEITMEILYGQDQCADPQGKFSLEKEPVEESNKYQYFWPSLLEPRLIYP